MEEKILLRREDPRHQIVDAFDAVQRIAFREARRLPRPQIDVQRQLKGWTEEKQLQHRVIAELGACELILIDRKEFFQEKAQINKSNFIHKGNRVRFELEQLWLGLEVIKPFS